MSPILFLRYCRMAVGALPYLRALDAYDEADWLARIRWQILGVDLAADPRA